MGINLTLTNLAMFISELAIVAGVIIPVVVWIKKLTAGNRCQLRHDMLQIYYRYVDEEKIPQYQYENFVQMYDAYKALKGNSFIDKIYSDIKEWEVISHSRTKNKER